MSDLRALEERLARLETRVRRAEDQLAIQALKARYGAILDARHSRGGVAPKEVCRRQAEAAAALFTEDGVWDGGPALGLCRGRAEIAARLAEPTLLFSWHYFVKPEIRVEGDAAQGTWDVLAPCTDREGRSLWMAGVERDTYARVDGQWLHRSMALEVVFLAPHETGWGRRAGRVREEGG